MMPLQTHSNAARLQANLCMLKETLHKVFPPPDGRSFEALLRELDRR